MSDKTGWDLGGAECPYDPDYTVVDVEPEVPEYVWEQMDIKKEDHDYVQMDLRKDFTSLPKRPNIKVGQMIRYLQDEGGHLAGSDIDPDIFLTFGWRLYQIWDGTGEIDLFDHITWLEYVLQGVIGAAVQDGVELVESVEYVNPPDEDLPGDWSICIKKV